MLEAARDIRSPIMVQFSNGGADFFAGKGLDNSSQQASVLGAISGAHVRMWSITITIAIILFY